MIRFAVLFASLVLSTSAFAANVTLSSVQKSPLIVKADMTVGTAPNDYTIRAPWFQTAFEVSTDTLISVVGIQVSIIAQDGTLMGYYIDFTTPNEVVANTAAGTSDLYIDALPAQAGTAYTVNASLIGWEGAATASGPALNVATSFVTQ